MVAVIASGASFLIGLNMVGTATISRSSTHLKTKLQDSGLASTPSSIRGNAAGTRAQSSERALLEQRKDLRLVGRRGGEPGSPDQPAISTLIPAPLEA
jgi:hypothetical protein